MPKKTVSDVLDPTDEAIPEQPAAETPRVELGQQVRYVLAGGKNAGQIRVATVAAICENGEPTLNVMVGHRDDLNVAGKIVGVQFDKIVVPLGSYIVDPDGYSEDRKPGTWHLA